MTNPVPTRDLRLDFFRGLALFFIYIDHIPGDLLSYFTLHSLAFCDAAEVFIFISGFAAALVYGRALDRRGPLMASAQIYRRVWQLYVAHVFIFVIFVAEVSYTVSAVNNPMYTEELRVGDFLEQPHIAIIQVLLLRFQPTFLDILPLYIVLLGIFPVILMALSRSPWMVLAASAGLYGVTQWRDWSIPAYPADETWYFNPLAWQFLFVIGAAFGYAKEHRQALLPSSRWLIPLSVTVTAVAAVINLSWVVHSLLEPVPALFLKSLWQLGVDKSNLAPLRLFNFLVLAIAVVHLVPMEARFLQWRALRPIILCGQHSLQIFCLSVLLSVTSHFVLAELWGGVLGQLVVNVGGMGTMIAAASLLDWYKRAQQVGKEVAQ
jgi:hypothetical protein